jgi:hypothetical protein
MFFGNALNWNTVWDVVHQRKSKPLEYQIRDMQLRGSAPIEALGAIFNFDSSNPGQSVKAQRSLTAKPLERM